MITSKINLSLCLLCAVLVYFLYQQAIQPIERVPKPEVSVAAQSGVVEHDPTVQMAPMPSLNQFSQLIERPPFSAIRRPPQPQIHPVSKPRVILVGTFVSSVSGIAVIQKLGAEKQLRLSLGEIIDGWTLESIQHDRIVLRSKSDVFEVLLRIPGSSNRR